MRQKYSWVVPLVGWWIATPVLHAARTHVGGRGRDVVLAVAAGFALGWAWYLLHPRPLIDRIGPIASLITVAIGLGVVVMYLPGAQVSAGPIDPGDAVPGGILLGLVIAERWAISPDYSRSQRRDLRRGTRLSPSRAVRRRLKESAHVDV